MLSYSSNESVVIGVSGSSQHSPESTRPASVNGVKVEVVSPLQTVSHSFHSLSLAPADIPCSYKVENSPLTSATSSSRPSRPPTLQPHSQPFNSVPFNTLTTNYKHPPYQYNSGNGIPHHSLSASSRNDSVPVTISQNGHSSSTSSSSSSAPTSNHVSINISSPRLRTSHHPVFHSTSELAAHHGIPQSLPPVPRTTRYQSSPLSSSAAPATPSITDFDFNTLRSNYLTMLSQDTMHSHSQNMAASASDMATASSASADETTVRAIMDALQGSSVPLSAAAMVSLIPDNASWTVTSPGFEFLTSPPDDSPLDDFLTTPALDTPGMNMSDDPLYQYLTSPAIADASDFGDGPLFGDMSSSLFDPVKQNMSSIPSQTMPAPFDLDGLIQMPSPNTPSLDPASLHPSPQSAAVHAPPLSSSNPSLKPAVTRRKSQPTGTRKNITPESLVPFDAPIQPRKYTIPSATSRKELPAVFARKRARSQAFGEEDAEELVPTPDELDAIEAKRRQNTLAARRSRKRKLEYQKELEDGIERERNEKEFWKLRAMTLENLLIGHGHEVPPLQHSS